MVAGSTLIAPFSRKNSVPRTAPGCASRTSWASSSRPGASGTGGLPGLEDVDRGLLVVAVVLLGEDLDGALRAVALAPAQRRVELHHRAELQDAVHQGLGTPRGAARVYIAREELVGRDDGVVVEDTHRRGERAHRDGELRVE